LSDERGGQSGTGRENYKPVIFGLVRQLDRSAAAGQRAVATRGDPRMTAFDYFMIFVTIVIALAIEAVARSIDKLIAARSRIRWNWMAPATAANSILLILAQFWLFWQLRSHPPFNNYLVALSPITTMLVLFLAASAALPNHVPEAGLDLKEWYFGNCARY